jgi:membrane associated rhomboid family serine protease
MRQTTYQAPLGFAVTPWVKRLLIANTVIFFVSWVIGPDPVNHWFAFAPSAVLTRPWGAVTYMFLHGSLGHLFWNMLILFFFGPPLEARWGPQAFLKYYLICGLGGVALSFIFVPSSSIIGASAALYGLMLAFAMTWPNALIYVWGVFPVKAKWLVGILFLVTVFSAFGGAGGGIAHFAHLGGLLTGFLYLKSDWRPGFGRKSRTGGVRVRRMAIVPREESEEKADTRTRTEAGWSSRENGVLDEVDRILDKISAQGMSSLTPEERKVLDEVSRRRRSN